jgi:signal peptidase I
MPYRRGEIVVFDPPASWGSSGAFPFVDRIVGIPGDRVELRDGLVLINGIALTEIYVPGDTRTDPVPDGATSWIVPEGSVFVMADSRRNSVDSRSFGAVPISRLLGRAWLRLWPLDSAGLLSIPIDTELPAG